MQLSLFAIILWVNYQTNNEKNVFLCPYYALKKGVMRTETAKDKLISDKRRTET